jgi:hypothetical protein
VQSDPSWKGLATGRLDGLARRQAPASEIVSAQIDGITTETNMEEPRDKKPSAVVNIAADGDVILVVGLEKVKIPVLSLFLKAASETLLRYVRA